MVACHLAAADHRVVAVDQRGHGWSDKLDGGYDFATVTGDLARLYLGAGYGAADRGGAVVGWQRSWNLGCVILTWHAGWVLRDGGFIDHQARPNSTGEVPTLTSSDFASWT
ncbi:MAG: hypothetical protein U0401_21730 [Anaerolineae bacterium]